MNATFSRLPVRLQVLLPDIEYVPDPLRIRPRRNGDLPGKWNGLAGNSFSVTNWPSAGPASVARTGAALLNRSRNENITIISSAPPVGTHLAALRMAAHSGRPWIADFRDPIDTVAGDRALLQSAIAPCVLERRILKSANLVLANTDSMQQAWCAPRYPGLGKEKFTLSGTDSIRKMP